MNVELGSQERTHKYRRKWFDSERFSERSQGVGRPLSDRLWEKIKIAGPNECWEWQGSLDFGGYGHIADETGKTKKAHRIVKELSGSNIVNFHVCHSCDNRRCCNPAHLFLGTHAENIQDRHDKGRTVLPSPMPGEQNPRAKLSEFDVNEIRWLYAANHPPRELAKTFSVSKSTIGLIVRRATWRHLP